MNFIKTVATLEAILVLSLATLFGVDHIRKEKVKDQFKVAQITYNDYDFTKIQELEISKDKLKQILKFKKKLDEKGIFSTYEQLMNLDSLGVTNTQLENLINIKRDDMLFFRNADTLIQSIKKIGSTKKLIDLLKLKNNESEPFVDSAISIITLPQTKNIYSEILKFHSLNQIRRSQSQSVFRDLWQVKFFLVKQHNFPKVLELTKAKKNGKFLLQYPNWILDIAEYNPKLSKLEEILTLKSQNNTLLFQGQYATEKFLETNRTCEDYRNALKLTKWDGSLLFCACELDCRPNDYNNLNTFFKTGLCIEDVLPIKAILDKLQIPYIASDLSRYYFAGFFQQEDFVFKDTEKPNAIISYPSQDRNGSWGRKERGLLLKSLKTHFDIKLLHSRKETTIYAALKEIPTPMYLHLAGHGVDDLLSLGENNLATDAKSKPEEYSIGLEDIEISDYLSELDPNAVIFLDSCLNGKGKQKAYNLANFIYEQSNKRTVISGIDSFGGKEIKVVSYTPRINLKLLETSGEKVKNITYIPSY